MRVSRKAGEASARARNRLTQSRARKAFPAIYAALNDVLRQGAAYALRGQSPPASVVKAQVQALVKPQISEVSTMFQAGVGAAQTMIRRNVSKDAYSELVLQRAYPNILKWLNHVGASTVSGMNNKQRETAAKLQAQADERGWTPRQLANNLYQHGVASTQSQAMTIARTDSVWAYGEGEIATYIDAGIEKKRWLVTEDDLLCPYCLKFDAMVVGVNTVFVKEGRRVAIDGGRRMGAAKWDITHPPLHPNCRCALVPDF